LCIHYSIDRNVEARQLTYESSPATVNFPQAAPVRSGRTCPSCISGAFTTRTAMWITLLLRNSRRLNLVPRRGSVASDRANGRLPSERNCHVQAFGDLEGAVSDLRLQWLSSMK
jgi:hypothetical protein